jgi:hypothetical protein
MDKQTVYYTDFLHMRGADASIGGILLEIPIAFP